MATPAKWGCYLEQSRRAEASNLDKSLDSFVTKSEMELLSDIVANTEGFTGADLEDLVLKTVERLERDGNGELTLASPSKDASWTIRGMRAWTLHRRRDHGWRPATMCRYARRYDST